MARQSVKLSQGKKLPRGRHQFMLELDDATRDALFVLAAHEGLPKAIVVRRLIRREHRKLLRSTATAA